jgi:hypothetical protein
VDGGRVVAVYSTGTAAEALTFTPSVAHDATALRRHVITSGWSFLTDPLLLPRAGGGLQVFLSGFRASGVQDPLNGTSFAPRLPDGSFGPPVAATADQRAQPGSSALLAPDGVPIWASSSRGLYLWRGATAATVSDLSGLVPLTSSYGPTLGRDRMGRYWLAWYAAPANFAQRSIYVVQFNPSTLQPIGRPARAPDSGNSVNQKGRLAFVCASACRVVYVRPDFTLASWAFGERAPARVAKLFRGVFVGASTLNAAYTRSGRLWVTWWDLGHRAFLAKLGNASGVGGKEISLRNPSAGETYFTGSIGSATLGTSLVLVVNWSGAAAAGNARFVDVVPASG